MDYYKKVAKIIKASPNGISITEIVRISKLSRSTIRTILAKMEGAKLVKIRNVGMAKLYSYK